MSHKKTIIIVIILFIIQINAFSQIDGLGAGIVIGEPSGLSAKLWLNEINAIDLTAAYSFISEEMALHIHGDYLFHFIDLFSIPAGKLPLYTGIGARIRLASNSTQIGIRAPVGIAYLFDNAPIEIFLEVAFIMDLFPATTPSGGFGLGVRYYF